MLAFSLPLPRLRPCCEQEPCLRCDWIYLDVERGTNTPAVLTLAWRATNRSPFLDHARAHSRTRLSQINARFFVSTCRIGCALLLLTLCGAQNNNCNHEQVMAGFPPPTSNNSGTTSVLNNVLIANRDNQYYRNFMASEECTLVHQATYLLVTGNPPADTRAF